MTSSRNITPSRHATPGQFAQTPGEKVTLTWLNAAAALHTSLAPLDSPAKPCNVYEAEPTATGHVLVVARHVFLEPTLSNAGWRGQQRTGDSTNVSLLDDFFACTNPTAETAPWQLSEQAIVSIANTFLATTSTTGRDRTILARALTIALAARKGCKLEGTAL